MDSFIFGMNTMGFLVAALFFLRFWQKTADTLFLAFGAAFLLFALNQLFLALQANAEAPHSWPFYFRLAGFAVLLFAILRKNMK